MRLFCPVSNSGDIGFCFHHFLRSDIYWFAIFRGIGHLIFLRLDCTFCPSAALGSRFHRFWERTSPRSEIRHSVEVRSQNEQTSDLKNGGNSRSKKDSLKSRRAKKKSIYKSHSGPTSVARGGSGANSACRASKADGSGDDPKATEGLIFTLSHPRVNQTKQYQEASGPTLCTANEDPLTKVTKRAMAMLCGIRPAGNLSILSPSVRHYK